METVNGMRVPSIVFKKIYDIIPESFWDSKKEGVKEKFSWFIEDAYYKAPEQWPDVYGRFRQFLSSIFGDEWMNKIDENLFIVKAWSIFSTLSEEEIIADIMNKNNKK